MTKEPSNFFLNLTQLRDVGTRVTYGIGSPPKMQVISQINSTARSCAGDFKRTICCLMLIQKLNRHRNQLKTRDLL